VPLGSDPDRGLLEFYDLWSAWDGESDPAALSIAARDPATGRLVLGPEHGIVFVLIPAGRFRMGAQKQAAQEPNFDPSAEVDEGPVREIALDPFLLAKHETTQAQWLRLAREANPSRFSPDHPDLKRIGKAGTLRHPVESVTWLECAEVARHAGFMLPTEAQWEYCARAGTATVFWFGDDPLGLRDRENVPDQTAKRHAPSFLEYFPWEDGFVVHGPVGSFQANPLGLHDMLGNVAEWCADWETGYEVQAAPGTGLREPPPGAPCAARIARGGAYYESHISFRSADRMEAKPDLRSERTGVRFARAIE
jgi:formylglycine-generating enzyme required for sulfatase activity